MTNYKNILIIGFTIIIAILITYIAYNNIPDLVAENRQLRADNITLKNKLYDLSFKYTVSQLANKQLRLDIADAKLDITALQVHEQAYDDMIEMFEYSLTYINYLQIRFETMHNDYGYPKFVIRRLMNEIIAEGVE